MKVISLLIIASTIVASIFMGGSPLNFIDATSLIVVLVPVIASVPARHGLEGFKELFREGENLHTMGVTAILAGAIGTIIGWVILLGSLADKSALGPALSISFLPIFYGLLIFLFTTLLEKK